jgi:hypothetical protein
VGPATPFAKPLAECPQLSLPVLQSPLAPGESPMNRPTLVLDSRIFAHVASPDVDSGRTRDPGNVLVDTI